jgi:hypothetical protein
MAYPPDPVETRGTTPEGFVDIEVDISDEQAKHLVLAGMFVEEDGVLVITPKGSEWLQKWCDEALEKASKGKVSE